MKFLRPWAMVALLGVCASSAFAQNFELSRGSGRSAFRDTSNLGFVGGSEYRVRLDTEAGNSDVYINAITLSPDENWNSAINLQTPSGSFEYQDYFNGGTGTYTLGTAISGDNYWDFAGAFRNSTLDASIENGIYTTTLNILGGEDSSSLDTLQSFGLTFQVAQKLDVGVTTMGSPSTIGPGQTTEVLMTVTNNMTGLDFVSTSWFFINDGFEQGANSLVFGNFAQGGNWFDKTVLPGESRTDLHSTWSAANNQAAGDYFGRLGISGGLYYGDDYSIENSPQGKITVVPAPSSVVSLLVGAGLLVPVMIRRKRMTK